MSNELVVVNNDEFAIANPGTDVGELIETNLAGEELTMGMFDRVKVPSGGSTLWMIPDDTVEGGERPEAKLTGVILFSRMLRSYWKSAKASTGTPPDCVSADCVVGEGDPGGPCKTCPMAQFGTDKNGEGRGQACKKKRVIFILTKDSLLPTVVYIPPKSLTNSTKYLLSLSTRLRKRSYEIVTEMSLVKKQNQDGQEYAEVIFRNAGPVENPEMFKQYIEMINPFLAQADVSDLVDESGGTRGEGGHYDGGQTTDDQADAA